MCTGGVPKDDVEITVEKVPSVPPTPPESDLQEHGVSPQEKQALLMIQELIRRRLGESSTTEN